AHNGHALDVVFRDDLGELFAVVHAVELGAAHQGDLPAHKVLVQVGVGVGGAVGGDEKLRAGEVGRVDGRQLDLARPLPQLGRGAGRRLGVSGGELPHLLAGAAALALLLCLHGGFVVGRSRALYESDSDGGAGREAVAQAVAVVVPQELCLAVYHPDGALMAGGGTGAAAVALLFINFNNLSDHRVSSFPLASKESIQENAFLFCCYNNKIKKFRGIMGSPRRKRNYNKTILASGNSASRKISRHSTASAG